MKRKRTLLSGLLFTALISAVNVSAQGQAVCGTDEVYKLRLQQHPELLARQKEAEDRIYNQRMAQNKTAADNGEIITIPIVFHIIHNGGPENISDATVKQQVDRLNIDYRKQNADTSKIRPEFLSLAADARIQFKLATVDPWGRCTNGIDRVASLSTTNATDQVKALDWWDSRKYLNVWVVESISSNLGNNLVLAGYSHFPWDAITSPWDDGILMNYRYVGKSYRTLTHEVGHYLGLYHTFQDSCSTDQDLQGDHVHDTPPVASASFGWDITKNSCHSDKPDLPDMIENYMDYADHPYMFTAQQVWRMRAFARERKQLTSDFNVSVVLQPCAVAGIGDGSADNGPELIVSPNPVKDHIMINVRMAAPAHSDLKITDITGKITYAQPYIDLQNGENKINLTRETLGIYSPGVYLLSIVTGNTIIQKKIIFE